MGHKWEHGKRNESLTMHDYFWPTFRTMVFPTTAIQIVAAFDVLCFSHALAA
jgi:hypothetical protein